MMYFHGTSTALKIGDYILPPCETGTLREGWRMWSRDKIFITDSIKSAVGYAKKAAKKFGGAPIIYQVIPSSISRVRNTEFIADRAKIIHRLEGA